MMRKEHNIAFKEWASVVNALAQGKQILILRKGGIREESGRFQVEYGEFFLFPTYEHQKKEDLKAEAHEDLDMILRTKPDPSEIPIRYYAQVSSVIRVTEENDLGRLQPYHVWSDEAIRKRFHFGREKGIYVLTVRMYRLPYPHLVPFDSDYAGCKSWVELKEFLSTSGAQPVLSDDHFRKKCEIISDLFPNCEAPAPENHPDRI